MLRDINIRPALNGFIVNMGCQTIVFETVDKLVDNLRDYLRDPDKTEKAFMASGINRKHTHPGEPVMAPGWPVPVPAQQGFGYTFPDSTCGGTVITASGLAGCPTSDCATTGTAP